MPAYMAMAGRCHCKARAGRWRAGGKAETKKSSQSCKSCRIERSLAIEARILRQGTASYPQLASFHPEMALFRNLGVNLRDRLCDVPTYVSAQSLEFLDLAKNYSFLNWKLTPVPSVVRFISGWALAKVPGRTLPASRSRICLPR